MITKLVVRIQLGNERIQQTALYGIKLPYVITGDVGGARVDLIYPLKKGFIFLQDQGGLRSEDQEFDMRSSYLALKDFV